MRFIAANSQTWDEAAHLAAGYSYLSTGDFRLNREHPPLIKELCAIPVYMWYRLRFDPHPPLWAAAAEWEIGVNFLFKSAVPADRILGAARLPNLLLGLFLVGLVGWWAYRLWGRSAGVVALALAALEPNLVAHSSLVTTDVGVALFGFLAAYLLYEYVAAPSWWRLTGVGVATGLALASKYSAVLLVPIQMAMIASHVVLCDGSVGVPGGRGESPSTRARRKSRTAGPTTLPASRVGRRLVAAVSPVAVILGVAAFVLLATYFFQGYAAWWTGLGAVMTHQAEGHPAFLMGQYSRDGWWFYFPVAFLIKTPVGSLLLILGGLIFYRAGHALTRREGTFLLVPVVLLLAALVWGRINIGLRHALPIYPFLFVLASRVGTLRFRRAWVAPLVVGLPLALTAISALAATPHQLAYFNELVGGPGAGYRYLGDSNVDWGQDLKTLRAYMDREGLAMVYLSYAGTAVPAAYGIRYQYAPSFGLLRRFQSQTLPETPTREVLAISVLNLHGEWFSDPTRYHWLYRRRPVAKLGSSIFVYELTGDADAHVRLGELYLQDGLPALAESEFHRALRLDPSNAEAARLLSRLPSRP